MSVKGYSIKQWLWGIFLLFNDYILSHTATEHIKRTATIIFYIIATVIVTANAYALYLIFWSLG